MDKGCVSRRHSKCKGPEVGSRVRSGTGEGPVWRERSGGLRYGASFRLSERFQWGIRQGDGVT
jgi:hypothetical protein